MAADSLAQSIQDLIPSQIEERPTKRRKVAQNGREGQILREDISVSQGNVILCRIIIDLVSYLSRICIKFATNARYLFASTDRTARVFL